MKTPPSKVIKLILLFYIFFTTISCDKDSDLLKEDVIAGKPESLQIQRYVVDDNFVAPSNSTIVLNVLENDEFENLENVTITNTTNPENGSVQVNEDNTISYTSPENGNTTETFTYTTETLNDDNTISTEQGIVTVNVSENNEPCEYGSACRTPITGCFDPNYPAIQEFVKAGVTGGIPDDLQVVRSVNPSNNLQAAINDVYSGGGGVILLSAGRYIISNTLQMKSGVVLRGVDKDEVTLESSIRTRGGGTSIITFSKGVNMAGLEDLTVYYRVNGCEPPDDLSIGNPTLQNVYTSNPCGMNNLYTISVEMESGSHDNWVDNCSILESGSHAIKIWSNHNTVSNTFINRAYNKGAGPGGAGYFVIFGDHNLVINNDIRRIRHYNISGGKNGLHAKYNVTYNNVFINTHINFHDGDGGLNLVENNVIETPEYNFQGGAPYVTGEPQYGHSPPGPNNYFYKNDTSGSERNMSPDASKIYTFTGVQQFNVTSWVEPNCGTFYPMEDN